MELVEQREAVVHVFKRKIGGGYTSSFVYLPAGLCCLFLNLIQGRKDASLSASAGRVVKDIDGFLLHVLGTLGGAVTVYFLAKLLPCTACVAKTAVPRWFAPVVDELEDQPLRLLFLLRISPLIPFNLLNYYAGACGRFMLRHILVAHLATAPA